MKKNYANPDLGISMEPRRQELTIEVDCDNVLDDPDATETSTTSSSIRKFDFSSTSPIDVALLWRAVAQFLWSYSIARSYRLSFLAVGSGCSVMTPALRIRWFLRGELLHR